MLNAHHYDILKANMDYNQKIQPNFNFKLQLYSNFAIDSIFIDSISSNHFDNIRMSIHLHPLVVFSFENISDALYFIFICQNLCSVIKVDNEERLRSFLNSIEKVTIVASKEQDIITLKKYVENPKFSFLNEDESLDSFYDAKELKKYHYRINNLTFGDNLTIGRYLFLSSLSLFTFFLRRNYFPTSTFDDPSFLYPPLFQRDQSNDQKEKKIPKLQDSDFIKIRIIGYGTNNVVTLVVHKTSGFLFSLKTILNKKSYKSEYKCFEKNINSRIIRCYGVVSQGINKAFILDFMSNGSLEDKVITDPSMKSKIIYQILYALDHLHLNGLVHCDIKLSSILLNRDFDAYLSGFSNLHDLVSINKKTINIGSFPFMAPEIIKGSDKYSFQADLYSFGVLIYEFTTGEKPYNGITLLNAIQKGAVGDVDRLHAVEGPITRLFEQCTSSDECGRSASFILRRLFESNYMFYANSDEEIVTKFIEKLKSEEVENIKEHENEEQILVDSDQRDDFKFILSNAQDGNPNAQYILGLMYSNGWIIEKNEQQAFEYFLKSANQNNASALYEVGLFYHKKADRIKIKFDYEKAFDMYKKASDQGLSDADNNIGELYVEGHLTKSQEYENNFTQAYEYFIKAADKGNHHSQCNLGKLLLSDKLGKVDVEKAIEYLKLAVSQGNSEAEVCLAKIYSDGKIMQKDDISATQLLRKAAYHKRPDAMREYGKRLIEGRGVQVNKSDGEKWIQEAERIEKENVFIS